MKILLVVATGIILWLSYTEFVKFKKFKTKDSLSGIYKIRLNSIFNEKYIIAEVLYKGIFHIWDIEYIGFEDIRHDIWDELSEDLKIRVNFQIESHFDDLLIKNGV